MNTPTSPTPTPDSPHTPVTPDTADTATLRPSPDSPVTPDTVADEARTTASTTTQPATPPEPLWLQGPAPFAIVLGILGLLVAGVTLLRELTDVTLPWTDLGPWSVVAAGLVVLVVGAIGLRSSRARG